MFCALRSAFWTLICAAWFLFISSAAVVSRVNPMMVLVQGAHRSAASLPQGTRLGSSLLLEGWSSW